MSNQPQTLSFELTCTYGFEARGDRPTFVTTAHDTFEGMFLHYWAERKRRAKADRASSATYIHLLTEHGKEMVAGPDPHYNRFAYKHAINGTVFTFHSERS